jgi:hypothetical protein
MKNFSKQRLTVFLPQEVKQSKKTVRSCRKSDFRRRSGGWATSPNWDFTCQMLTLTWSYWLDWDVVYYLDIVMILHYIAWYYSLFVLTSPRYIAKWFYRPETASHSLNTTATNLHECRSAYCSLLYNMKPLTRHLAALEESLWASNLHTRPLDKSESTWLLHLDRHTLIAKVHSHNASNERSQRLYRLEISLINLL